MKTTQGAYVAVVGPSGSGKDAVMASAREGLKAELCVVFPRRVITRPVGRGEQHIPVSDAEFEARATSGGFAVTWEAHGLRYGIESGVARAVEGGAIAVVNSSRAALGDIEAVFRSVAVVRITVSEAVRRKRLAERRRESAADIERRLARPDPTPEHPVDIEIVNDGSLLSAAGALRTFLETLSRRTPSPWLPA